MKSTNLKKLGKLAKVRIRNIWPNEERDFTPWLMNEGIELLKEELKIPSINIIGNEVSAGSYRVDILAEDIETNKKIIIENQYNKTDHNHLGKLLTYAAAYDASIVIWIVEEATEEHKSAVDWLNRISESSDSDVSFFLVQIEIWKIEDSKPAVKFNIISSPNDWIKIQQKALRRGASESEAYKFSKGLEEYLRENSKVFKNPSKASLSTPAYYRLPLGTSKAWITININRSDNLLRVGVYILDKKIYDEFFKNKEQIEKELDHKIIWDEMPDYRGAKIYVEKQNCIINDEEKRNEYYEWLMKWAEKFYRVFRKYIR